MIELCQDPNRALDFLIVVGAGSFMAGIGVCLLIVRVFIQRRLRQLSEALRGGNW